MEVDKIIEEENTFNIFKIEFYWYEDDHEETFLGKGVEREEFEKDLKEARDFAQSLRGKEVSKGEYLGKGYITECLPEYYEQIVWFLKEKKGYTICYFDNDTYYRIDDSPSKEDKDIGLTKFEETINHTEL